MVKMSEELSSRSFFLTVLEAGSMIALNVLSLTGNILVCIAVYRNVTLRTTTNLYIIALAVSDLLSAIVVMPMSTGVLITDRWPFGETLCKINSFFAVYLTSVSPVIMGLMALNIYVKICKSDQQYKRFFSARKTRVFLAAAWTLVGVYQLITRNIGSQEVRFAPGYATCLNFHFSLSGRIIRFIILIGVFLILPLAVTIFSYRKVIKKIREHNIGVARALNSQPGKTGIGPHEIRISRSLFVVVFAFVLCWVPLWVISVFTRLRIVANMPRNVELICTFCLGLSNTINPFIYAGINPLFKREFQRIIRCNSGNSIHNNTQTSSQKAYTIRGHAETPNNDNQPGIAVHDQETTV